MNPVNEVVAAILPEVRRLRALAEKRPLKPVERQALIAYTEQLRQIEHGRGSLCVALIAGKKSLDKLPVALLGEVLGAVTGLEIEPAEPSKK